jgi:hypothetical protein
MDSPNRHTLGFEMMPPLVHLIQASLKHNGIVLGCQTAKQFPSSAVERREHILVTLDFRLQILQR